MTIQEKTHTFGREQHLNGIVTLAADAPHNSELEQQTAFILVNAAAVHKVGPFRMSVIFARSIACHGLLTFRYDHCDLGDSRRTRIPESYEAHVLQDFLDAQRFLETTYGIKRFIVCGLCTGADLAFKVAVACEKVCGVVMLDGYGYPTQRYYLGQLKKYCLKPRRVCGFLLRLFKRWRLAHEPHGSRNIAQQYLWRLPPKSIFINDMAKLSQRPLFQALFCYSADADYITYDHQLERSCAGYAWVNCIDSVRFNESDHTFMLTKDRQQVINAVLQWLERYFHRK